MGHPVGALFPSEFLATLLPGFICSAPEESREAPRNRYSGSLGTAWSFVFGVNGFTCAAAACLQHPVCDVAAEGISNRLRIESGRETVLQERSRNQPLETSK